MKTLRLLKNILRHTHTDKILMFYLPFVLADALVIWLAEPNISGYFDALWYCCEVVSTTGFGDIIVITAAGKICSMLLTVCSVLIIAVITGIITNFCIQLIQLRQKNTVANFLDRLERLPELNQDELKELSEQVKNFRNK